MICINCKNNTFSKKTKGNYTHRICKSCNFVMTFHEKQDSNLLKEVVDYYLEVKNGMPYKDLPKTVTAGYPINLPFAKKYLQITDGDVKPIKKAIDALNKWGKDTGMNWSFALVGKYMSEPKSFDVIDNEKKDYIEV